jgi:hypothetical protein
MRLRNIFDARFGRAPVAAFVTVVTVGMSLALTCAIAVSGAKAAGRQPRQPKAGPGGSATPFRTLRVIQGGSGSDAWEILEPSSPTPPSAPLVILMHGYFEFSGYSVNGAIARHTALKGNVVIYPRWQTGIATPCPGPIDIEPCITSAATAIHDAIAFLHAHHSGTQPRLDDFGSSFGGIITADITNRWKVLRLPKARAIFLDDPHDGVLRRTTRSRSMRRWPGFRRQRGLCATRARPASYPSSRPKTAATRCSRSWVRSRPRTRASC